MYCKEKNSNHICERERRKKNKTKKMKQETPNFLTPIQVYILIIYTIGKIL